MPESTQNNQLLNIASILVISIASVCILVFTQKLLVPFVLAIFLWFIVKTIVRLLDKMDFFREKIPSWLKTISAFVVIILSIVFVGQLLISSVQNLSNSLPLYEANINHILAKINEAFDINIISMATNYFKDFNFTSIVMNLINSLTDIFGSVSVILLYVIFLLLEESTFNTKLQAMVDDIDNYKRIRSILAEISHSIESYISLKTLVSFLTAFLSFIALWAFDVEAPVFWAFLIFILNYIPTIGSLIATGFPAIFALLQFGDWVQPLIILGVVGGIQLVVGNVVEPRMMGNSLNISPLVVIVALSVWGAMWGITGMILSVPIMVVIIIICSKIPALQSIAILLSEKGNIKKSES